MHASPFTLVLLNYRRPENLTRILDAACEQTARPTVFVWNNDPSTVLKDERVDWMVNSSRNFYCWPRWPLASSATTEFVAVMDDDLCFATDSALERLSDFLHGDFADDGIVGPEGVRLGGTPAYYPESAGRVEVQRAPDGCTGPVHFARPLDDEPVDIVKGRFMAMRTSLLNALPSAPRYREVCDDIAVSWHVAAGRRRAHIVPAWLGDQFVDLPGKEGAMALSAQPSFRPRRESATSYYFFSTTT